MDDYRERIESRTAGNEFSRETGLQESIERDLRLAAVSAEREEITGAARERLVGGEFATKLVRELDLLEIRCK